MNKYKIEEILVSHRMLTTLFFIKITGKIKRSVMYFIPRKIFTKLTQILHVVRFLITILLVYRT